MKGVWKMKRSNLIVGALYAVCGAALLSIAVLTDSVLDSLLFGFGAGAAASGLVMICRYFYWSTEKNRERYRQKTVDESIEIHDELKTMLRDKSGRYSYTAGIMTVSASIVVFSILGKLGKYE